MAKAIAAGRAYALWYPIETTGLLPPFRPVENVIQATGDTLPVRIVQRWIRWQMHIKTEDDFYSLLGLYPYPPETAKGVFAAPYPEGKRPSYRMGVTLLPTPDGVGFTFSCAACHAGSLFGRPILGLNNRFPRAHFIYDTFKPMVERTPNWAVSMAMGATEGQIRMFTRFRENLAYVAARRPAALGLDTSLGMIHLSLELRGDDPYAEKDPAKLVALSGQRAGPRSYFGKDGARTARARRRPPPLPAMDSKPMVWWNAKYKTRWLSDASLRSGSPILINLLWNEIGRGSDLHELAGWVRNHGDTVDDLTAAVFSSEAPRFTDFFPARSIDLQLARRGEVVFNDHCADCHGEYEKAWQGIDDRFVDDPAVLRTVRVTYPSPTEVYDVGTDSNRRTFMARLERMNDLTVMKESGMVIHAQPGYVAPPLVGIWARWPYLHNNSVPTLADLLNRAEERPVRFYMGEATDPATDFDAERVGYPTGSKTPTSWKRSEYLFDTRRKGLSNAGHDEGITLDRGRPELTPEDKKAVIEFLKTL